VLVFLIEEKLDAETRLAWGLKLSNTKECPRYSELDQFIETRISTFDTMLLAPVKEKSTTTSKRKALASYIASTIPLTCLLYKRSHLLYQCFMFLKQTASQRFDFIKKQRRCLNCFSVKHSVKDCTNTRVCRQCSKRYHILIHFSEPTQRI